jgi:hypothetical protein
MLVGHLQDFFHSRRHLLLLLFNLAILFRFADDLRTDVVAKLIIKIFLVHESIIKCA